MAGRRAAAVRAVAGGACCVGATTRAWLTHIQMSTIADVCFTAGTGRSHFEHRAALVVDSVEGARELLSALAEDRQGTRCGKRRVR